VKVLRDAVHAGVVGVPRRRESSNRIGWRQGGGSLVYHGSLINTDRLRPIHDR